MNYSREIRDKANTLFDRSFNCLSFELLKKAVGEDRIIEYIERPSNEIIKKDMNEEDLKDKTEEEQEEVIDEFYFQSEHFPMWNTIFEAKEDFISERIINQVDDLYDLGIGVIAPTDNTHACLFIAGAGYNFYNAHWIPLFIHWGWIEEKEMKEKEKRNKIRLTNWNEFGDTLEKLAENRDETIKRHANGLLKALKL